MYIGLVSYSISHNYLCDVIVPKLIKMKIVWIPSHRVIALMAVCCAFCLTERPKTRYLITWGMPKEKAMNIKIKINHREQVQWRTKTCCYFFPVPCFYLKRYENCLPLWELFDSFSKHRNALKKMNKMRAEYISTEWEAAAFIVRWIRSYATINNKNIE